ncbi:hypothetical protein Thi970DRAFT_01040 [Thiorhodovibrio frisius]|uniref:Uncharacterized protein n=1 Tax=Thiorhodovibrio frisius TaxID=631362 RepID=H8YY52_9GAMM|nr:hypothetical protein Thi970DRAFT_01040 [Thiorhodovibrio frisius]WPL23541.1 hypothetical protein Thiofri_03731 [Thiorhodovibrio frisius]
MANHKQPSVESTELATANADASRQKPRQSWHLLTNQLNLMYTLSAGLVTGPKGFGGKHYADPLSVVPGWVPLFDDVIPPAALELARSEESHLVPIVASLDLSALRGLIHAQDTHGQLRALQWPEDARGDERMLWIPAPLPVAWIQGILFPSKEARALVLEQAADYANVPLDSYKLQVKPRLYSAKSTVAWPIYGLSLPDRDRSLHHVSGVGAVQGLLVGLGNRGDALVTAARHLTDPTAGAAEEPLQDPVLRGILAWAQRDSERANADVQGRMLARLLTAIIDAKTQAGDATDRERCPPDTQQVVLDGLEAERQALAEPKWQDALARLIADLKGSVGLGDATVSELLQRHQKPFSRGLILFFLRQRCEELLRFEQPLLTDQDRVVAAALFGARGGWMELPQALKDVPGLTLATSHRMAMLAQQADATGLDLGPAPPRIQLLRELLSVEGDRWAKRQQDGALELVRGMGWQQVLKTRISLGKGDYRLQVDGRGAHLLLDGEVKAVTTDVDMGRLFELLAMTAIPARIDAKVRKTLKL